MGMSASTLATELKNMPLFDNEADAAAAWADAFDTYFQEAEAGGPTGGTVNALGLVTAKSDMEDVLKGPTEDIDGIATPDGAAGKIQEAIIAYWSGIVAASAWPNLPPAGPCVSVTSPTGLSGIATALTSVFLTNVGPPGKSQDDSMDAVAGAIHTINIVGGIANFPPTSGGGLGPLPIA